MICGCPESREVEMGKVIVIKIKTIGAPVVREEKKEEEEEEKPFHG